jgi:hypothetical protein
LGVDPAPAALRDRIQRLFADESAPIPLAGKPRSFSLYARWITSAAAILLVGFIIFQTYRSSTLPAPGGGSPFPQATLVALVETHKRCCTHPTHRGPNIRQDSFPAMAASFHQGLGKTPVLAADLSDTNWKLRGGAICPVSSHQSAHLVFERNGQTLSVFSLDAQECQGVPDGIYQEQVNDCVLAISAKRGTLHCFLGHCPHGKIEASEMESLLKRHSDKILTPVAFHRPRGELVR